MNTGLFPLARGWQWSVFADVATVVSDLVDPTLTPDAPHIAPNHIESWTGKILPYGSIRDDGMTSAKHRFRKGQILYSKIRPYLAKAALATFDGLCSADMYPVDTDLESPFLLRWMLTPWFTNEASRSQGRTVLPKINREGLARLRVPVAPLSEQRRIIAKLDAVFAQTRTAKARLERLPALLEKLQRSILAAAFRGDLTKDWRDTHADIEPASLLLDRIRSEHRCRWEDSLRAKGKDPRKATYVESDRVDVASLSALPASWAWTSLAAVSALVTDGDHNPPKRVEAGVPHLTAKNVKGWQLCTDDCSFVTEAGFQQTALRYLPLPGDVIVTCVGTLGRTAVVPHGLRFSADRNLAAIRPESGVMSQFLMLALNEPRTATLLFNGSGSSAQPHLYLSDLRRAPIPVAPSAEQAVICDRVNALTATIEVIKRRIAAISAAHDSVEQAALAKAFRGELVSQDPTDEPASVLLERILATRAAEPERPRRGRGQRRDDTAMGKVLTVSSNGHATNDHHDESLDLVVAMFQVDRRLTATAITEATGLHTSAVKKALKTLVHGGQIRLYGGARDAGYEWTA